MLEKNQIDMIVKELIKNGPVLRESSKSSFY